MRIFLKYHLKEYFFYTFSFLLVFSGIITLVQGIIKLQEFLDFNPSLKIFFKIFIYSFFQLLSFIYVLSLFVGILFAIHRIKYEREMIAFYSLGYAFRDFLKPLFIFSIISLIITFLAHFYLLPWAKRELKIIKIELIKAQIEAPFSEKIPIPLGSDHLLYVSQAQKKENVHYFKNIFFIEKTPQKKGFFISKEGILSPKENLFSLSEGWGFFLSQDNIEVFKFGNYKFEINFKRLEKIPYFKRGEKTFSELKEDLKKLKPGSHDYFSYLNEYYQRFFFPLSAVFLTFQAFLLGIFIKISHRFLLFFIGISIFLIFYVIYNFFSSLGENGNIYPLWSFITFYFIMFILLLIEYFTFCKHKELYL